MGFSSFNSGVLQYSQKSMSMVLFLKHVHCDYTQQAGRQKAAYNLNPLILILQRATNDKPYPTRVIS